jgi:hypothetical protein
MMTLTIIHVLALLYIVLLPYAVIWAVNTLFSWQIPHTLSTHVAVIVLYGLWRLSLDSDRKPS